MDAARLYRKLPDVQSVAALDAIEGCRPFGLDRTEYGLLCRRQVVERRPRHDVGQRAHIGVLGLLRRALENNPRRLEVARPGCALPEGGVELGKVADTGF